MTDDQPVLPTSEPPPPPPPPDPAPAPARERFDLGHLFAFAFRDPKALSKFVIGSLMVVLIPLFGLGLLALLGFGVGTARGALRGDEHPMPDWDDFGTLLTDGLKALGVILGYSVAVILMGLMLVAIGVFWAMIGQSMGSPVVVATSVIGSLTSVFFLVFAALAAKALIPLGILQLAATGRFTAAFQLNRNVSLVRQNFGTYIVLLLSLILFAFVADLTFLFCLVGLIPGYFWGMTMSGAAIGQTGRLMGVRLEPDVA
jgi:hypothetical protein